MKILLTAKCPPNGLRKIGGVQSWCTTVGRELVNRGHNVVYAGPKDDLKNQHFDFGILANASSVPLAPVFCDKYVTVCHGIIEAEKPPAIGPVLFTSEGVQAHWGGKGAILRQPIDLDFWRPHDFDLEPSFLTRFSYRSGLSELKLIAKEMDLEYIHLRNASHTIVREHLRQSACVIATGRASLEAMACGVPVVIADHRSSYQGPLLDLDTEGSMARNYSGRGGVVPDYPNLTKAIIDAIDVGSRREHVERFHNVVNVVDYLLRYAE